MKQYYSEDSGDGEDEVLEDLDQYLSKMKAIKNYSDIELMTPENQYMQKKNKLKVKS